MENKPLTRPLLLQLSCLNGDKLLYRTYGSFKNKLFERYDHDNIIRPDNPEVIIEYVKHLFIATFAWGFFGFIFIMAKAHVSEKSKYPYRNNPNYKKVVKEGIFFDTVEYHER